MENPATLLRLPSPPNPLYADQNEAMTDAQKRARFEGRRQRVQQYRIRMDGNVIVLWEILPVRPAFSWDW